MQIEMTTLTLIHGLRTQLQTMTAETFNGITDALTAKGCSVIKLDNPIMHQYIDDQIFETITAINIAANVVIIDTGSCLAHFQLKDLPIDQLIAILEAIDEEKYVVIYNPEDVEG